MFTLIILTTTIAVLSIMAGVYSTVIDSDKLNTIAVKTFIGSLTVITIEVAALLIMEVNS